MNLIASGILRLKLSGGGCSCPIVYIGYFNFQSVVLVVAPLTSAVVLIRLFDRGVFFFCGTLQTAFFGGQSSLGPCYTSAAGDPVWLSDLRLELIDLASIANVGGGYISARCGVLSIYFIFGYILLSG